MALRNNSWAVDARVTRIWCILVADAGMEYANEKEGKSPVNVVGCDPGEGNTVDGVQNHVSEAFAWVTRKMKSFAKTASVVDYRDAVAGGGMDCAGWQ